ncbi:MAG: acetyl-CoA carboxylase biotin carboxyl carrier protein subunit [Bosea sp.]|uniref:acetyl-CoA carboxylase biotin carboxyl carrier protein subunit n=1 Tax=Bosea sp. (in: a-proteobacteria) TaxID=1871050 RepID=UPI00238B8341|nr:acetyl-CoA carboxylase biotin carboxyl carrier protein subunit [Bosea sp. (in: a-proteobacteria)]MCP4733533.1 acetyl-CoA carboxylase biotin carboxyl carrier protein subunit [Bosea sp. (in: a-proteobacteria)]
MVLKLDLDGTLHHVTILARQPHLVLSVDGRRHVVENLDEAGDGSRSLSLDGEPVAFARAGSADGAIIRLGGRSFALRRRDAAAEASAAGGGANVVRAPMPGTVVVVHKRVGDKVQRGETVVTIESMKLQMKLDAPRDGEIAEIAAREGEGFDKDAVLARLAAPAEG